MAPMPSGIAELRLRAQVRKALRLRALSSDTDDGSIEVHPSVYQGDQGDPGQELSGEEREWTPPWDGLPAPFMSCLLRSSMMMSPAIFLDDQDHSQLENAAEMALLQACRRAGLRDGDAVLDWGCGWGTLTFYIAEYYPKCTIVAVTNSWLQCDFVQNECDRRKFRKVKVVQAESPIWFPNSSFDCLFAMSSPFDWLSTPLPEFMSRASGCLKQKGRCFVQLPTHRLCDQVLTAAVPFLHGLKVPAMDTILFHQKHMTIQNRWASDGRHAAQTIELWLGNLESNLGLAQSILEEMMPADRCSDRLQDIKVTLISTAEACGFREGREWFFVQYLFVKR